MGAGKYAYLSGIIPVMFIEYFVAVLVFRYGKNCCCRFFKRDEDGDEVVDTGVASFAFQQTYMSYNKIGNYILLLTRLLSFGYICGVSVVDFYLESDHHGWHYFSLWNVELISFYFLLAICCSLMNICTKAQAGGTEVEWSPRTKLFGRLVQAIFEVAGGTAFFITVFDFAMLDRSFSFWNASLHFASSLSMTVELLLNSIPIRYDHFPVNLSWALLYLIFIWPLTVMRKSPEVNFPYDVLDTSTSMCFFWYTLLFLLNLVFYTVWYLFYLLKIVLVSRRTAANRTRDRALNRRLSYLPTAASERQLMCSIQGSSKRVSHRQLTVSEIPLTSSPQENNLRQIYLAEVTSSALEDIKLRLPGTYIPASGSSNTSSPEDNIQEGSDSSLVDVPAPAPECGRRLFEASI